MRLFVFIYIPGGSFIFNIFMGCSVPPRGFFALRRDARVAGPPSSGSTRSCARLAHQWTDDGADGIKPMRRSVHSPCLFSICDLS